MTASGTYARKLQRLWLLFSFAFRQLFPAGLVALRQLLVATLAKDRDDSWRLGNLSIAPKLPRTAARIQTILWATSTGTSVLANPLAASRARHCSSYILRRGDDSLALPKGQLNRDVLYVVMLERHLSQQPDIKTSGTACCTLRRNGRVTRLGNMRP